MKPFLLAASTLCCLYFTVSCTKSNAVPTRDTTIVINRDTVYLSPKHSVTGLWVGSYFLDRNVTDSFLYQFAIRPDGLIYTIGSGTNQTAGYASGPWTLNGVQFSATLTTMAGVAVENIQTITATYDSVGGRLYNGIWIDTRGNGGQTGTFSVKKVQ
ncbi:hypothetical protein [Puia sp.]|jgi:hypothetical protein|uniref:hypothetical protein n=1 Tax=Puia sp. TaxID=2045100 RepID=UPI002F419730